MLQKHLGTIISLQLFFSLLFGGLVFWMFFKLGTPLAEIVAIAFGLTDFASHHLASVILATIGFIVVSFLAIHTVGAHYGIHKNSQSTFVGMLASSTIVVALLCVIGPQFIIPLLLLSLVIAFFGFHNSHYVHTSLQEDRLPKTVAVQKSSRVKGTAIIKRQKVAKKLTRKHKPRQTTRSQSSARKTVSRTRKKKTAQKKKTTKKRAVRKRR